MATWTIVEMCQNPYDKKHKATDPEADYSYGLSDSRHTIISGLNYSEVELLMKRFRVQTASELVGKTFQSNKRDAQSALYLLLTQICHDMQYIVPSYQSLRDRAAVALAQMTKPDYGDVDEDAIQEAFFEVWDRDMAKKTWFNAFKAQISQMSNGQVSLIDSESREGFPCIQGPANYCVLVKGKRRQKVILGPYSTPVTFC